MAVNTETWKNWECQTVDRIFPLNRYLAGNENSAVYLTEFNQRPAALKLIPADRQTADAQLSRWQDATRLAHPHLLALYQSGRCQLDGVDFLYVVMEHAEEDLSQVLPHRSLTTIEALEMSAPALEALDYLHREGFVHAHLKPSNIMAAGDQLKLTTDGLVPIGEKFNRVRGVYDPPEDSASAKSDIWSLGVTFVQILTQRLPVWNDAASPEAVLPAGLMEPFAGVARQCLKRNPKDRPGISEISDRLANRAPGPFSPQRLKWAYAAVAIVVAVAGVLYFSSGGSHSVPPTAPQVAQAPVAPTEPKAAPKEPAPQKPAASSSRTVSSSQNDLPEEVLAHPVPEIPQTIRNTIRGRVRINIKLTVDAAGNVAAATLASSGSKYMGERTLAAARQWKFRPQNGPQEWAARFTFQKNDTSVSAKRTSISVEKSQ